MHLLVYVQGQLGFAFDGRTLYVRILAPKKHAQHVAGPTPGELRAASAARHRTYRARKALAIRSQA